MAFGDADLRAFFRSGPVVSFAGQSRYADGQPVQGLMDRPIAVRLSMDGMGGVDTAMPELRLPANAFNPMPDNGDSITVDGVEWGISNAAAEDDGSVMVYGLKAAE